MTNFLNNFCASKIVTSSLQEAINTYEDAASKCVGEMTEDEVLCSIQANDYKYSMLEKCVFVGHVVTDLDSVSGAIGAAEFYKGIPALAEKKNTLNTEILWALEYWKPDIPKYIKEISDLTKVCLVDHNQASQTSKCIDPDNIIGIIDHHSPKISSNNILNIDIQKVGSVSTIIANRFIRNDRSIKKPIAGMLLSAILSDTLNLKSPTTTNSDRLVVAVLAKITGVKDIDNLADEQFQAKSKMIDKLSDPELIMGDMKSYELTRNTKVIRYGWSTVECISVGMDRVLERKENLIVELSACKKKENLDYLFFSVVDIVLSKSKLFICGEVEKEVAEVAFNSVANEGIIDLGDRVSRKKQFIPAIKKILSKSNFYHTKKALYNNQEKMKKNYGKLQINSNQDGLGTIIRSPESKK